MKNVQMPWGWEGGGGGQFMFRFDRYIIVCFYNDALLKS